MPTLFGGVVFRGDVDGGLFQRRPAVSVGVELGKVVLVVRRQAIQELCHRLQKKILMKVIQMYNVVTNDATYVNLPMTACVKNKSLLTH